MRRFPLFLAALLLTAAGTALAAPTAVSPKSVYTGKTAQGYAVRLGGATANHRLFRYRAKMTCNDGTTYLDDYFTDTVTVRHNYFNVLHYSDGAAVTTRVTGKLGSTSASGTVRIVERFSEVAVNGTTPLAANGAIVCDSKAVTWHART